MTYYELINDQLTLQELSLVSGGNKGPECKKKLIEVVWRNGEMWWDWEWECPPGVKT